MRTFEITAPNTTLHGKICRLISSPVEEIYPYTVYEVELLGGRSTVLFGYRLKEIHSEKPKATEVFIVKEERTTRLAGGDNPIYNTYEEALGKAKDVASKSGKSYLVLKAVAKVGPEKPRIKVEEL